MRIIAIALSKGGVGKTTTAVNLGAALVNAGKSVLIIDTDTQGQAAQALGVDPEVGLAEVLMEEADLKEAIIPARENLYLLAGGHRLAQAKRAIGRQDYQPEKVLSNALAPIAGLTDYVLIDTAPSWDSLSVNVMVYAQELLCPVALEGLAIQGLLAFIKSIEPMLKHGEDLEIKYILPTAFDRRTAQASEYLSQLETHFKDKLLDPIPYNVRLSEAPSHGETIYEYAPTSKGAKAYTKLAEKVISNE